MGLPAARVGDIHLCGMTTGPVPHVGGPIITGEKTVLIAKSPAARVGDVAICVGPADTIAKGSTKVFIGKRPAARHGDLTVHGGAIGTTTCKSVFIG